LLDYSGLHIVVSSPSADTSIDVFKGIMLISSNHLVSRLKFDPLFYTSCSSIYISVEQS